VKFDEAMSQVCSFCKAKASHHRLTTHGNLYCLVLNSRGRKRRDILIRNGRHYDDASIHRIEPKYLDKGDFEAEVGETIQRALTTDYEESGGQA